MAPVRFMPLSRSRLRKALGGQDSQHLATAADAKRDAKPVQTTRFASSQAQAVASLAAQVDALKCLNQSIECLVLAE